MDNILSLLPFFDVGVIAAVIARFTGINLSMMVLMALLYIGGTPLETVMTMLVFNAFTYFTVYTQRHILGIKDLTFFPGVKMLIPVIITLALATFNPFLGIMLFIAFFLAETFAKMYHTMDLKSRPSRNEIIKMSIISSVLMVLGVALIRWFPADYYYILAGVLILCFAFLMLLSGDRRRFTGIWDGILYISAFVTGISGIIADDWFFSMRRQTESALAKAYPIVMYSSMIVALIAGYAMYQYFSVGSLFVTIGAALTIRFFGVYNYGLHGKFSYLALGATVLAVLVFWLIQPVPTGLPEVSGAAGTVFDW